MITKQTGIYHKSTKQTGIYVYTTRALNKQEYTTRALQTSKSFATAKALKQSAPVHKHRDKHTITHRSQSPTDHHCALNKHTSRNPVLGACHHLYTSASLVHCLHWQVNRKCSWRNSCLKEKGRASCSQRCSLLSFSTDGEGR